MISSSSVSGSHLSHQGSPRTEGGGGVRESTAVGWACATDEAVVPGSSCGSDMICGASSAAAAWVGAVLSTCTAAAIGDARTSIRDSATGAGRKVALTRGMMTRVYDQYPKRPAAPAMATFRAAHRGEMPVHGGGRGPCGGGGMPVLGVLSRNALAAMRDETEAMGRLWERGNMLVQ